MLAYGEQGELFAPVDRPPRRANLTACNDGSTFVNRRTFAEIADIIEAQL